MKNKLLVSAFAMAFVALAFTSCKEKVDFDAICDGISNQTVQGIFSGASLYGDSLFVTEYNFKKDGTVEFVGMVTGDGIYKAPIKAQFSSWEFGEYNNQKLGRYIILHPADGSEARKVNFIRAAIEEDGLPIMGDKNDKVTDLPKTETAITGKKWHGNDTTFYKIDTIMNVMQVDSIVYKHKEGKKYVIDSVHYDTTYIQTKMKWAVGPKTIAERRIELNRNETTLENTGKWYMVEKAYEYDKNRNPKQVLDTISSYDFHWTFVSYASTAAFSIVATEDGTNHAEVFEIKYDSKMPSLTIYKQVLPLDTVQ